MLQYIAAGRTFGEDDIYLYPLNEYVSSATDRIRMWSRQGVYLLFDKFASILTIIFLA